jgi:hypothetical protein
MQSLRCLPMAPMRPMAEPTTAERAFIMERIMVVRPTGIMIRGAPMAHGAATPLGTMAREAPEGGAEAPLHGIMDRGVSAVTAVARPRGVAAPAAQPAGGGEQPRGVAALAPSTGLSAARAHGDGN